ncbi:MAG: biopolymer transporter ExbD [Bacteriovoracaceae bacterium]
MYRKPSSIRKRQNSAHLNLIPILDSFLVLLYFLLLAGNLIQFNDITSQVPIVSHEPPPADQKVPLALTLQIQKDQIEILTGIPATNYKTIPNIGGTYDFEGFRNQLLEIKKKWPNENTLTINPIDEDLKYENIVKIMDMARLVRNTDEAIYAKDKAGIDKKITVLYDNIIFGNLR